MSFIKWNNTYICIEVYAVVVTCKEWDWRTVHVCCGQAIDVYNMPIFRFKNYWGNWNGIGYRGYSSIYSPLHTWHVLEHDILCHSILLLRMLVAVAGQEEVQW